MYVGWLVEVARNWQEIGQKIKVKGFSDVSRYWFGWHRPSAACCSSLLTSHILKVPPAYISYQICQSQGRKIVVSALSSRYCIFPHFFRFSAF